MQQSIFQQRQTLQQKQGAPVEMRSRSPSVQAEDVGEITEQNLQKFRKEDLEIIQKRKQVEKSKQLIEQQLMQTRQTINQLESQQNNNNLETMTGMSAMEGANMLNTQDKEVSLTVTQIFQNKLKRISAEKSAVAFQNYGFDDFEPLTGSNFEANMCNKTAIGEQGTRVKEESKANQSAEQLDLGQPGQISSYQNQPYAVVTSASEGVSFQLPLCLLPGDINVGNIIQLKIQRDPIKEQRRHQDILMIQQQFINDPFFYNNTII
mmetsp:Transcript_1016/g.1843  ORF Transcript_1016/g.1843 Transcript_1016/m.1843 type:complete len:264 (+) Transcript_1016:676-1467(+)